jgi:hypothetical protein
MRMQNLRCKSNTIKLHCLQPALFSWENEWMGGWLDVGCWDGRMLGCAMFDVFILSIAKNLF